MKSPKCFRLESVMALVVSLMWGGCSRSHPGDEAQNRAMLSTQRTAQAAGIRWAVPSRWLIEGARPMRIATYRVPPNAGDAEPAECATYFFGTGQGGSVEANLQRWAGQFAQTDGRPAEAQRESRELAGLKVHTIRVSGTYLAAGGPMSPVTQTKPNFAMLGAIIEAPEGLVFFKLTGPSKTIESATPEFQAILDSLSRQ